MSPAMIRRSLGVSRRGDTGEPLIEVELVVELGVDGPVGGVAAGRDVEVLHLDALHHYRDAARVALTADLKLRTRLERKARSDGDAMPALLAADRQMRQAHLHKGFSRGNSPSLALDLLQAQYVRRLFGDEARHPGRRSKRTKGVDVPGGARRRRMRIRAKALLKQRKRPGLSLGVKVVSHAATGRGLGPAGTRAAEVTPPPSCVPKLPLAEGKVKRDESLSLIVTENVLNFRPRGPTGATGRNSSAG